MTIFGNVFEKNVKFVVIFDIPMAIIRRVRSGRIIALLRFSFFRVSKSIKDNQGIDEASYLKSRQLIDPNSV